MKRIISAVLAVGLLAAGPLAGRVRAGEEKGGKDGEHAAHMEKMMKERLGLSDDQAAKLKSAWEAEKAAVKPLRKQAKESRRKLEEQVRGLASDKDIQATLDQLDADRKAMMDAHQKVEATVASVLKPYQRAKMRLMMARRKGGRSGRWSHKTRGHESPRGEHEHSEDD